MKRQELAHILRAACNVTDDRDVLVLSSQSILGTYDEDDLPTAATASIEADIAFLDDPDRAKADDVEGLAVRRDLEFVAALIREKLLDLVMLQKRSALLGDEHAAVRGRISSLLASYSL